MKDVVRARTPMKETTATVEILVHPEPQVWRETLDASSLPPFIDFYE